MANQQAASLAALGGRHIRWMMALLLFVGIVLTFQALSYDGIMHRLGEWQFGWFARYFPPLTMALLLGIVVLLWAVLRWARRKLAGRSNADATAEQQLPAIVIEQARAARTYRILAVISLVATAATVGTGIHYLQLPGPTAEVGRINLAQRAPTLLREGSVRIDGIRPLGPVSSFSNDLVFARQTIYLLPVGRTRVADGSEAANLFVQVMSPDRSQFPTNVTGLLRTAALPHEVATMYRNADYPVAGESAVVFLSEETANRPTLMVLIQLAIMAVISLLFLLFARKRRRRIDATAAQLSGSTT